MKSFNELGKEQIAEILNIAMDDGEWHTPSAHDINFHNLSNPKSAFGWCNISQHNTYHDKEVWFNINKNTVQIWENQYEKGKANLRLYRPIYNLKELSDILSEYNNPTPPNPEQ